VSSILTKFTVFFGISGSHRSRFLFGSSLFWFRLYGAALCKSHSALHFNCNQNAFSYFLGAECLISGCLDFRHLCASTFSVDCERLLWLCNLDLEPSPPLLTFILHHHVSRCFNSSQFFNVSRDTSCSTKVSYNRLLGHHLQSVQTNSNLLFSFHSINVHLQTFSPLPKTINLNLPSQTTIEDILQGLTQALNLSSINSFRITTQSGSSIPFNHQLSSIHSDGSNLPLTLVVNHVLVGGKGGFGSMLRAQGGKMGKNQDNNDSCRDLNGRRLSTMKEAKK
jgi:hypothetical protein